MDKIDAQIIKAVILNVLVQMNLSMKKCRGQCYDGCSTMAGSKGRVETVKRLCEEGNIERQFTNHSLCATTATRGLEIGIPDKFVMQRTGHEDVKSLQKYQRSNISTKINISRAFESGVYSEEVIKHENNVSENNVSLGETSGERARNERETKVENAPKDKVQKVRATEEERSQAIFNNCKFVINRDFKI